MFLFNVFGLIVFVSSNLIRFIFIIKIASFYGASYVRLPLEDAKSTTDIQFKFRTHRADAFLFLAAGTTDYCLLLLESGGVKVFR